MCMHPVWHFFLGGGRINVLIKYRRAFQHYFFNYLQPRRSALVEWLVRFASSRWTGRRCFCVYRNKMQTHRMIYRRLNGETMDIGNKPKRWLFVRESISTAPYYFHKSIASLLLFEFDIHTFKKTFVYWLHLILLFRYLFLLLNLSEHLKCRYRKFIRSHFIYRAHKLLRLCNR